MTKVMENQQVNIPNMIHINVTISLILFMFKIQPHEHYEYLR